MASSCLGLTPVAPAEQEETGSGWINPVARPACFGPTRPPSVAGYPEFAYCLARVNAYNRFA